MAIVGFNFTKLNIENKGIFKANEKISSDLKIIDIIPEKSGVDESKEIVKFQFEFSVEYAGSGSALIGGDVIYLDEPEKIKKLIEDWKNKKGVSGDILNQVLNVALFRCNIKALSLSQEVNLPPHFQLPRVEMEPPKGATADVEQKSKDKK